MSSQVTPDEALDRALLALQPDAQHCVVIGGWALRLLAQRPEAVPLGRELLVTTDLDVALRSDNGLPSSGGLEARLTAAGFTAELSGTATPPVTAHVMQTSSGPFSVEFVSPLVGSRRGRDGRDRPMEIVLGVTCSASLGFSRLWPRLGR